MYTRLDSYIETWLDQNVGSGPELLPNDSELRELARSLARDVQNHAFDSMDIDSYGPFARRIGEARRAANAGYNVNDLPSRGGERPPYPR